MSIFDRGGIPGVNGQPGIDLGNGFNWMDLLGGGIAAAGGAYGQSQPQQSGTTSTHATGNTTTNQSQQTSQTQSGNAVGDVTPTEDPLMTQFRQGLLPIVNNAITQSNKPIFDEGYKANFINQLNNLSTTSLNNLTSSLARRGALNSGNLAQGASDINTARFSNLSQFFAGLPFQEQQAQTQRLQPLLSLATNFAGRAPIGQKTSNATYQQGSGSIAGTSNTAFDNSTTQKNEVKGPGFFGGLVGGLSKLAGTALTGFLTP